MADEGAQGGQAVALRVPVYVRFPNTNVRAPLLDELELGPQRGAAAVAAAVRAQEEWQEVRDRRGLDQDVLEIEVLGPHAEEFAPLGLGNTVAAGTRAICIVAHQNQVAPQAAPQDCVEQAWGAFMNEELTSAQQILEFITKHSRGLVDQNARALDWENAPCNLKKVASDSASMSFSETDTQKSAPDDEAYPAKPEGEFTGVTTALRQATCGQDVAEQFSRALFLEPESVPDSWQALQQLLKFVQMLLRCNVERLARTGGNLVESGLQDTLSRFVNIVFLVCGSPLRCIDNKNKIPHYLVDTTFSQQRRLKGYPDALLRDGGQFPVAAIEVKRKFDSSKHYAQAAVYSKMLAAGVSGHWAAAQDGQPEACPIVLVWNGFHLLRVQCHHEKFSEVVLDGKVLEQDEAIDTLIGTLLLLADVDNQPREVLPATPHTPVAGAPHTPMASSPKTPLRVSRFSPAAN